MLSMNERAALERLRRGDCHDSEDAVRGIDMSKGEAIKIAARIALRDHLPDDDEPVTIDRIDQMRVVVDGIEQPLDDFDAVERLIELLSTGEEGEIRPYFRNMKDLRDLCRVLRVELKE